MALPFQPFSTKKRTHVVAIDLGSRYTKAVSIQRKGAGFELLNYCLVEAPVVDRAAPYAKLPEHLKAVMQDLGARTKQVMLCVGAGDAVYRVADMPLMPVLNMRQMLKIPANAKNYLQQELVDHVYDCYILSAGGSAAAAGASAPEAAKSGQKAKVLIAAAKRQLVSELQGAAKAAGLVLEAICPGALGAPNAFEVAQPEAFAKEIVAVIDIGFKNTTISILHKGNLELTRVVGVAGDKLTAGVAESMGVPYAEGEAMKIAMTEDVQAFMGLLLDSLGKELRASLDFFENQHDRPASQAFISGGSARSSYIVDTLRSHLLIETRGWNPLAGMDLSLPPEKMGQVEQLAPQLAVAVGSAMAAF